MIFLFNTLVVRSLCWIFRGYSKSTNKLGLLKRLLDDALLSPWEIHRLVILYRYLFWGLLKLSQDKKMMWLVSSNMSREVAHC